MNRYVRSAHSLTLSIVVALSSFFAATPIALGAPPAQTFVLRDAIQEYWDEGYSITDFAYGDDTWAVVMTEDAGYGLQTWRYAPEFPTDFIEEQWNAGMDITSLAYGDGMWAVAMTEDLDLAQAFRTGTFEEIKSFIQENWEEGYNISEVAYGDGEWVVVMNLETPQRAQHWFLWPDWPKEQVEEKWQEGFSITDFTYGATDWLVVMTQDTGFTQDAVTRRVEWPAEELEQDFSETPEGSVVSLDYGDGLWVYTFAVTEWDQRQAVVPRMAPTTEPTATDEYAVTEETINRLYGIQATGADVIDSFSVEDGAWQVIADEDYSLSYQNGEYLVSVDSPEIVAWGYIDEEAYDFYVEADVRHYNGAYDSEAGIAFRCLGEDSCYFFLIHPDGLYSLDALVDSEWQFIIDPTESSAIKTGVEASNRLAVLAEGNRLLLLINDTPVAELNSDAVSGTEIGLAASATDEGSVTYAFDDFTLWILDAAPEPSNMQTPSPTPTLQSPTATIEPTSTVAPTVPAAPTPAPLAEIDDDPIRLVDATKATAPFYQNSFTPEEQFTVESDEVTVRYVAGESLRMRVISPGQIDYTGIDQDLDDFYLEVDAMHTSGPTDAIYGVSFRESEAGEYYLFFIDSEGWYNLMKFVDDEWYDVTLRTESASIDTSDGAVNRLGVLANGDDIALFVNGEFLTAVSDGDINGGGVSVALGVYEVGNAEVAFDNIAIWEPVAAEPSVRPTPQPSPTPTPIATEEPTPPEITAQPTAASVPGDDLTGRIEAIKATEAHYTNEFSASEQWAVTSDEDAERFFEDEALHLRIIPAGKAGFVDLDQLLGDFYMEFDVAQVPPATDANFGVRFRTRDIGNHYLFVINSSKEYTLASRVDGEYRFLAEWTPSDSILTEDQAFNRLGLLAEGDTLSIFANGVFLTSVSDDAFQSGATTLTVGSMDENSAEAVFDNIEIWKIE